MFDFSALVETIASVDFKLRERAVRAVNVNLTIRNWIFGYYIQVYEQNGADRAVYGGKVIDNLSRHLEEIGVKNISPRTSRLSRQFYRTYPQIWQTVSAEYEYILPSDKI